MTQLVIGILLLAIAGLFVRTQLRRVTIFEFERGLLYVGGRFRSLLEPGQYWIWASTRMVTKLDVRVRVAAVPGQEVLTADGIAVKKLFTQVTKARQDGLAALERARGETAALRNLTNAAHLVADNPALIQLRLLQVVGENSGNTIVLGVPQSTPLPIATARTERVE